MKVLFVHSVKSKDFDISPFTKSQADSLSTYGVDVSFYRVTNNGIKGMFKHIVQIYKMQKDYQIVHSHYSTNAFLTLFSVPRHKRIVSFLGSDVLGHQGHKKDSPGISVAVLLMTKIVAFFTKIIIVKSAQMKESFPLKQQGRITVVPNGVDFEKFSPLPKKKCREELNLDLNKKLVLFLSSTKDQNKNFSLAREAFEQISTEDVELVTPFPIESEKVPLYINAADILLITSLSEGSSNILKEALACNCSVVSVPVGDAEKNLYNIKGSKISTYASKQIANDIDYILNQKHENESRDKIVHLKKENIANQIVNLYNALASNSRKK